MNPTDNPSVKLEAGDALIFVDVQNDFLPGGSLAVPRGGEIIPVLNRYIETFQSRGRADSMVHAGLILEFFLLRRFQESAPGIFRFFFSIF